MLKSSKQHEKLCITVLQTLKEMVSVDVKFGAKVRLAVCHCKVLCVVCIAFSSVLIFFYSGTSFADPQNHCTFV